MPKKGMSRPALDRGPKNDAPPVPELQGKAKRSKVKARPIVTGTEGPELKVFHR